MRLVASHLRRFVSIAAVAALATTAVTPAAHAATSLEQHIGVPAYIPTSNAAAWNTLSTSSSALGFAIANVANGPGSATADADWIAALNATHQHGTKVLGYVDTGYWGSTSPARLTRLGETSATAWLVQAEQDINRWYDLYGSAMDGIFLDDAQNVCGPTGTSTAYVDLYAELNEYVHRHHRGALTVLNPGVAVPQCYEDVADVLLTFEGTYSDFVATTRPEQYVTAPWQREADPNKFYELVYGVPDQAAMTTAIARSKADNAGYVYITPLTLPNPWLDLPPTAYWNAELAAAQVTDPTTPATPARPRSRKITATSVELCWASSRSALVAGYDVYLGGTKIGSATNSAPDASEFRVTGLDPSTTYSFTVRARQYAGAVSAAGPALSLTTAAHGRTAPGAPRGLQATAVAATSARLSWNASRPGRSGLRQYDVLQDGVRILTVGSTVRSVHVGDLAPGTSHRFTVIARDDTGSVSSPSAAVTVTTTDPIPVTGAAVTFTSTAATFSAQFNLPFTFQHVFVDSDADAATGYPVGGIGADVMIEGSGGTAATYRHTGAAADFTWDSAGTGDPLVSSADGVYGWRVPSSVFGSSTRLSTVFNGSGSWPDYTTPVITTQQ